MMEEIFAGKGLLARHLPSWEPRPGQQEMAEAVAVLLDTETDPAQTASCLVIEAETGLGKTLAYLVPAVLSGRRVVVSTNTRNLQDQILHREIPFIRHHIAPDLQALCVKGKQNYLCLYRWHQYRAGRGISLFKDKNADRLDRWVEETKFADRAELPWLSGGSGLWQKICCLPDTCMGSDCPDAAACFLGRLRRKAAASRLLVVNHHLLFSDLAVRRGGFGEVLPRYDTVIFDEAHHVENVATTFFGTSVSRLQLLDLTADIERSALAALTGSRQQEVLAAVQAVTGSLQQFVTLFPKAKGRFLLQELLARKPEIGRTRDHLLAAMERLSQAVKIQATEQEPWEQYEVRSLDLIDRIASITAESFEDLPPDEVHSVDWFEKNEKNLILSSTPVNIATELQITLFSSVNVCVFTSATLSVGGSFSYFFKRLGLPDDTQCLSFPSPFNYPERTLLYIPDRSFPEPAGSGYQRSVHKQIKKLVTMSGGRALVLFTSFAAMETAWHALEDKLEFSLLRQGTAPRHELLTRFMEETSSVLFAVASFWEGVDIPGESLSLVIIDKLPFEVPGDPVIMARINRIKAEGGNPFFEFQVPRAILTLRQGVGRLLRSSADRGVMAILDVRLFSKGYGKRFLASLPPSPVTSDLDQVAAFFHEPLPKPAGDEPQPEDIPARQQPVRSGCCGETT